MIANYSTACAAFVLDIERHSRAGSMICGVGRVGTERYFHSILEAIDSAFGFAAS